MELAFSILLGLLIMEIYSWLPKFAKWLLERTVRQVHSEDRERCREEWNADLDAFPNSMVMLVYAFRNFNSGAVNRINTDFVEAKLDEIDKNFEEVSALHQTYVEQIHGAKLVLGSVRSQHKVTERELAESLSSLRLKVLPNRKPDVQIVFQNALSAFERLNDVMIKALDRSSHLMDVSIDSSSARLGQVHGLLKLVSTRRNRQQNCCIIVACHLTI